MVQVFHALRTTESQSSNPELFPSVNTLIRVYGDWLFSAVNRVDEACEEGRAQALATLCRIFVQPQSKEQVNTNYLHRFYEAYLSGLSGDLTTLISLVTSSEALFTLSLPDVHAMMPDTLRALHRIIPACEASPIKKAINHDELRRSCYRLLGTIFAFGEEPKTVVELSVSSLLAETNTVNGRFLLNQLVAYSLQHPILGVDKIIVESLGNWPVDVQLTACSCLGLLSASSEGAIKLTLFANQLLKSLNLHNYKVIVAISECILHWHLSGYLGSPALSAFVSFLVRASLSRKHSDAEVAPEVESDRALRFFPSTKATKASSDALPPLAAVEAKIRELSRSVLSRLLHLENHSAPQFPILIDSAESFIGDEVFLVNGSLVSSQIVTKDDNDERLFWVIRGPSGRLAFEYQLAKEASNEETTQQGLDFFNSPN